VRLDPKAKNLLIYDPCGESNGDSIMVLPPKDRIELVLISDQAVPIHLWVQSTSDLAKRIELSKEKSIRVLGGSALFFIAALYLFPAPVVMSLLMGFIVLFPMTLVGMAGYFRNS
jgi:hypothetical protein